MKKRLTHHCHFEGGGCSLLIPSGGKNGFDFQVGKGCVNAKFLLFNQKILEKKTQLFLGVPPPCECFSKRSGRKGSMQQLR